MNKYKETFGVDISKDAFDVHGSLTGYDQYKNDENGLKKSLKELPEESLVVMWKQLVAIIIDLHSFFSKME